MKKGVTIWYEADIGLIKTNPFFIQTPFGQPYTIGKGNEFEKAEALRSALVDACERLEKAGFPALDLEQILTAS